MKIDFTPTTRPSHSQVAFAKVLSCVLQVALPKQFTEDAYQEFIDAHADAYDEAIAKKYEHLSADYEKAVENAVKVWLD